MAGQKTLYMRVGTDPKTGHEQVVRKMPDGTLEAGTISAVRSGESPALGTEIVSAMGKKNSPFFLGETVATQNGAEQPAMPRELRGDKPTVGYTRKFEEGWDRMFDSGPRRPVVEA